MRLECLLTVFATYNVDNECHCGTIGYKYESGLSGDFLGLKSEIVVPDRYGLVSA